MTDSLQAAARRLGATLEPLERVLSASDAAIVAFVQQLGWTLPSVPPALKELGAAAKRLSQSSAELELNVALEASGGTIGGSVDAQYVQLALDVADLLKQLAALPSALGAQLPPAFVAATNLPDEFARRLLDLCLYDAMARGTRRMEPILRLVGLVEVVREPADAARFQPAYLRRTIRWDRFGRLLGDPASLMTDVYGWGTPTFDGRALLDHVMNLSFRLAGPGELDWPTPERIQALTGALPPFDDVGPPQLLVPFVRNDTLDVGLSVLPLVASGGALPGVALAVWAQGGAPPEIELSDLLTLQPDEPATLGGGASVTLRPGRAPEARIGLEGPSGSDVRPPRVGATLKVGRSIPMTLLALPGLGLETQSATVGGGVGATPNGPQPYVDVGLKGGKLRLGAGDRDSFLARILPTEPVDVDLDLELVWTQRDGVTVRGGGGLNQSIPLHVQLGPIRLDTLHLVGTIAGDALRLETSLTGGGALGPLAATVERVGLVSTLALRHGNLGPANLEIEAKAPNGVGLTLDAGVVKGGGYLYVDAERGEYAGALELEFSGFLSLKAIGVVTTRMPDGSKGFSLLILITADFGTGIQLGFGFTLLAVGGLLGLNRTMNLQALMEGVRTSAIDSVMFPRDVIANAPRIISDLRTFFPVRQDTFLIGPMAKLGWGTPTLVSVSVGVIIEIPGNIAIVGKLRVAVPADDVALIDLQANFAGAIEFDKRRLYFFASLHDSRIVFLTIDGELGLLVAYGDDANLVVTVGGFHPRFSPPPLPFPSPRRIEVSLLNTPVSRMRIEGYFAVTSNTVQFGARVEVFFGLDALNVKGNLAFDALFQFSPFHFVIEISASLSVNVFGAGLFSVGIRGTLEGPAPWHVNGHGSISLLFWDIDVDFETTWGESRDTQLPPVAVMPVLAEQFGQAANWRALPPAASNLLVSLRRLPAADATLVLHPLGSLAISQRALPLELTLDRVGNRVPSDVNRLSVDVGGSGLAKRADTFEQFAPAQFKNYGDADKLSKPAFAPERGGVELAPAGADVRSSVLVKRVARYEEVIIDSNYKRFRRRFSPYLLVLFDFFLGGAAVARSDLSQAAQKKLVPFDDAIAVTPETYAVAFLSDKKAVGADSAVFSSEASADEYLRSAVAVNAALSGALQVIPSHELAA